MMAHLTPPRHFFAAKSRLVSCYAERLEAVSSIPDPSCRLEWRFVNPPDDAPPKAAARESPPPTAGGGALLRKIASLEIAYAFGIG
ncbi:protein of unknown function [Magnetospirillum gryphiswaldense MSR-1 v2]|uniref:Uncharacterized protein n=1 Tax=Magnetospirillum gryphiswaldense (strain DSM 6361 / JCM 21280 / NBRC 15271 / MSR-1) TaxID=431944 RepID=V6F0V5_MAGGM|nr:protein of unknown function [Magnetospirillum gryphiswaldense MSR-1 v2]